MISKNKRFKKIYIEILNYCNLNCSFCSKTSKEKRIMTVDEFNNIINQVKDYTDYVYLHVQGEPLLHPQLESFLDICEKNNIYVNLTTNVTLLDSNKIDMFTKKRRLRQINFSLQALQILPNKTKYYDNIIDLINRKTNIYLSLRLWGNFNDSLVQEQIKYFEEKLGKKVINNMLTDHVFFSFDEEFTWPNVNNPFNSKTGKCLSPKQLAILCDGTVVPCCLDKDGVISLGNIYNEKLDNILSSKRYIDLIESFKKNSLSEELCCHCTYLNRFKK